MKKSRLLHGEPSRLSAKKSPEGTFFPLFFSDFLGPWGVRFSENSITVEKNTPHNHTRTANILVI
jgi:hypothetical protein